MPPMTHRSITQFWYPSPAGLGVFKTQSRQISTGMEEPRETGTFPLPPNQQLMGSPRDRQQMLSAALEYIPKGKEVTGQSYRNLQISSSLLIGSVHTNLNYLLQSLFTFFTFFSILHFTKTKHTFYMTIYRG